MQRVETIKKSRAFIFQLLFINLSILIITKHLLKQIQKNINKLLKKTKKQQVLINFFFASNKILNTRKLFRIKSKI